ncbi:Rv1355c family protein [Mycobacterium leprae]|uniref:Rv1355c family protein n=1 Tax=Mycobacterium leprae TaxID=1769 RepID=UPI000AEB96D6|nr:Rv1355c family protein [Mycobacterium leprae]
MSDERDVSPYARVLALDDPADAAVLQRLRADSKVDFVDHHERQLQELLSLLPTPDPQLIAEPCRWVYYPWRHVVVSMLGPRGFRAVRLDRNRNEITAEEQVALGRLHIGVAGLSVGHVIAHTLAAQGLCGQLRLADFDRLELSNLNRVPATVFDLGLNKAEVAARRIAELDPYLTVRVFDNGLTFDTVDQFLEGLDVVVEQCDSLDIKALLREGARSHGIPVLMATSDRGLIDVERFDLEPRRSILHGLLGELDIRLLPEMSNREKIPYILRFLEAERLSPRTATTLVEIDRSLSTWPQLAGDVALGATAVAEAVRRIGLGEELRSGRARIDVASALNQLTEPDMARHRPANPTQCSELALSGIEGVIATAAIRAPSGGNLQPWHIDAGPDALVIRIAPEHTDSLDVGFRGSAVAVGAALFNARVAAAAHGVLGPVSLAENVDGAPLRVTLSLGDGWNPDLAAVYEPMLVRETNRNHGKPTMVLTETIDVLHAAAVAEGARLHLLTARDDIVRAATILAAADRSRYLTPRLHEEMISELRWPGDSFPDTGIDVRSLEMDWHQLAAFDVLRRTDVMELLAQWNVGAALGQDTHDRVVASSALAVISVPGHALADYARGGSAVEAIWVAAQRYGFAVQPISPVFLYAHSVDELHALSAQFADELGQLGKDFRSLARIPADNSLVLVLRLTVAGPASVRSRRSFERIRLLSG